MAWKNFRAWGLDQPPPLANDKRRRGTMGASQSWKVNGNGTSSLAALTRGCLRVLTGMCNRFLGSIGDT